jgi:hydroxymethylpyrimidine/phosphomethylpyrimidine kinase
MKKNVLIIGGSDSSGGAGIAADIRTAAAHDCNSLLAITALTAQNTKGVQGVFPVAPACLEMQLDSVFSDYEVDAVKIGMVWEEALISVICDKMQENEVKNIVLDPLVFSSSDSPLLDKNAVTALRKLMSISALVTPNIHEAEYFSGVQITDRDSTINAGININKSLPSPTSLLIKGGHFPGKAKTVMDLFMTPHNSYECIYSKRVRNVSEYRGTGCTLATTIACFIADEIALKEACKQAKAFMTEILEDSLS